MNKFLPGVLEIQGQKCLIIPDLVSSGLPTDNVILLKNIEIFNICCNKDELINARAQYGSNFLVFGYWQTLYASRQWHPKEMPIAAYQNESGEGQCVVVDIGDDSAVTYSVSGGKVIARGNTLDEENINWLEIPLGVIHLPAEPAMTITEKFAHRGRQKRKAVGTGLFATASLAAGVVLGAWFADLEAQRFQEEISSLQAQVHQVSEEIDRLAQTKRLNNTAQSNLLMFLNDISRINNLIAELTPAELKFNLPLREEAMFEYILKRHPTLVIQERITNAQGRIEIKVKTL